MSIHYESIHSSYLWFDKITDIKKFEKAIAVKSVSLREDFFTDHFPKYPIMPGVLQLEGMIQLGSWLVSISNDFNFAVIPQTQKGVDFRDYVRPGDRLVFEAEILSLKEDNAVVKAKTIVEGKVVAKVKEIVFRYLPLTHNQVTEAKKRFYLLLDNS